MALSDQCEWFLQPGVYRKKQPFLTLHPYEIVVNISLWKIVFSSSFLSFDFTFIFNVLYIFCNNDNLYASK